MQYLYIIKCEQFYKIGVANDVESRLAQLSTGNPFPLKVEIVYEFENAEHVEKALHMRYKSLKQRGEWFKLDYEELKNIHSICLALGASAYEYSGNTATDEVIEEAEIIETSLDDVRTELRMSKNGSPRGVVLMKRGNAREVVGYVGITDSDFEKYLEKYKNEHPNSKLLSNAAHLAEEQK